MNRSSLLNNFLSLERWKGRLRRYAFFLSMVAVWFILLLIDAILALEALNLTGKHFLQMLAVLPPIFLLLGLLDAWVPREVIIRLTGEGSGAKGAALAFLLGSFASGPLYAAFPIAGVMIAKGAGVMNVMVFIGAWSTTKIPQLLFEMSSLGWRFMLLRFILNLPLILLIGLLVRRSLSPEDLANIYQRHAEDD